MNTFKKILIIFLLHFFVISFSYASEQDIYSFSSDTESEHFNSFLKEIRCIVCQNQNLAESNAPLANDLRNKIYHMMIEGKSNQEIKTYLVKRYGEFILLTPPFHRITWILWLFPLGAILFAWQLLRRLLKA